MADHKSAKSNSALSPDQIEALRQRLDQERVRITGRLAREESVARDAEPLTEPTDAAELTREQDDAALFGGRDRALVGEIDHALAKIEAGTYGLSEATGDPIDFRRLLAIPWARTEEEESPPR